MPHHNFDPSADFGNKELLSRIAEKATAIDEAADTLKLGDMARQAPPGGAMKRAATQPTVTALCGMTLPDLLDALVRLGCTPGIYRRGTVWRAHVNCAGNFWEDHVNPAAALKKAVRHWGRAGRKLDGTAAEDADFERMWQWVS